MSRIHVRAAAVCLLAATVAGTAHADPLTVANHGFEQPATPPDSFYVVQKAWRPAPDQAEIKKWNEEFFSFVQVCDDRSEASPERLILRSVSRGSELQ